jgi:site-specific DNA-adenine methylase
MEKLQTVKQITTGNIHDKNYLNMNELTCLDYETHIKNGGILELIVFVYETNEDKENHKNYVKLIYNVKDFIQKGLRDKKNMSYRYKIIDRELILEDYSHKAQPVQTIFQRLCTEIKKGHINPKNTVLFPWLGSKRPLTDTLQNEIEKMDMDDVKYFIDTCGGSMNFTINNISKINSKHYVLNDINPILYSTYKGLKENPYKVIEEYENIRDEFYSIAKEEFKNENTIKEEFRQRNMKLRRFYMKKVSELDNETDIFKISALFIWKMLYTTSGRLKYLPNGKISNVNYNWKFKVQDKIRHIKYYSYILNKYDVIIENMDMFDLFKKYYSYNTFVYIDPPYLNTKEIYNTDNEKEFQLKVLESIKGYKYVLYSNEDCKDLYDLNIHTKFDSFITFSRNHQLGKGKDSKSSNGREFLGVMKNLKTCNSPIFLEMKVS